VERQRFATEFCVRLGKSGSETLQLIHQAYGDELRFSSGGGALEEIPK
jgi:hypothetical protein